MMTKTIFLGMLLVIVSMVSGQITTYTDDFSAPEHCQDYTTIWGDPCYMSNGYLECNGGCGDGSQILNTQMPISQYPINISMEWTGPTNLYTYLGLRSYFDPNGAWPNTVGFSNEGGFITDDQGNFVLSCPHAALSNYPSADYLSAVFYADGTTEAWMNGVMICTTQTTIQQGTLYPFLLTHYGTTNDNLKVSFGIQTEEGYHLYDFENNGLDTGTATIQRDGIPQSDTLYTDAQAVSNSYSLQVTSNIGGFDIPNTGIGVSDSSYGIGCWFNFPSTENGFVISNRGGGEPDFCYGHYIYKNQYNLLLSDPCNTDFNSGIVVPLNEWVHIVMGYNSSNDANYIIFNENTTYTSPSHKHVLEGDIGILSNAVNDVEGLPAYADRCVVYEKAIGSAEMQFMLSLPVSCTPSWSCNGYAACDENNEELCNSVEDLNNCGGSYTGDYSEFTPHLCDYCTPDWSCSGYTQCDQFRQTCNAVNDTNLCGESYSGNYSEFPVEICGTTSSPSRSSQNVINPNSQLYQSGEDSNGPTFSLLPGEKFNFWAWIDSIILKIRTAVGLEK